MHYWTSGQPYLTQLTCEYLDDISAPTVQDVDAAVERIVREDKNHLAGIIHRLDQDLRLYDFLVALLSRPVKFMPSAQQEAKPTLSDRPCYE